MTDSNGQLGSLFRGEEPPLVPPYLALEKKHLRWAYEHPQRPMMAARQAEAAGMLNRFVGISDDSGVLAFARRYGVLGLCRHGLPATHTTAVNASVGGTPEDLFLHLRMGRTNSERCFPRKGIFRESVERWLDYVNLADLTLRSAAAVRLGKTVDLKDLHAALDEILKGRAIGIELSREPPLSREDQSKADIAMIVSTWLRLGGVRPALHWDGEDPKFLLGGGWTFGLLGVQLAQAVAGSHDLATCSGCGKEYVRRGRKPQAGRRNFCPDCGSQAASRLRQRDRARRIQERGEKV